MKYLIICDSRYRKHSDIVFMVDRAKRKDTFWSTDINDALFYTSKEAALLKAKSLKLNNPRIIDSDTALSIHEEIQKSIEHEEAMEACEIGWDGHK
jgi:hypothetical protein